jgi:MFS family permease
MTHSPVKVALVLGLRTVALLLSPVAGVIADRFDRRKIMMIDHLVLMVVALIFAGIILADQLREWHLYAFAFAGGLAWAVNNPVRQVLAGNSVPREELTNAIALNSMGFNTMRMVGPAVGGILIAAFGPGINFLIQAILYVVVFFALIPYRPMSNPRPVERERENKGQGLGAGFSYIWQHPNLLTLVVVTFMVTFTMMAFITTQIPAYADRVLGDTDGRSIGWLFSSMGAGGLLGTFVLARFSTIQHKGLMSITGVVGSGVTLLILAQVDTLLLAMVMLAINQLFFNTVMITNNVVLQTTVPNEVRGRVIGVYMLDIGLQPAGGVIAGFLVAATSITVAWTVGATAGLIGVTIVALAAPGFRRLKL